MQAADRPAEASKGPAAPQLLRSAFRDLHGSRLHAFALLLTLGDRGRAAELASEALATGSNHVPELRHPERAAAWLRARVLHGAGSDDGRLDADERLESLADLHVGPAALAGLAGLTRVERAGLIATAIERLDRRDVGAIVGRDGDRLDKLLRRARRRYLDGATATPDEHIGPPGPIGQRILESAARTMA